MILSVPHTGTRFLSGLTGHAAIHVHAKDDEIDHLARSQPPVICPLRDPWSVYVSDFSRRGTGHAINVSLEYAWRRLAELHERYDIFYVPVDQDPDFQRARLEALLGRDLDGAWEPVGHIPSKEPPFKDWAWVYELPMVKEFYSWQPPAA